MASTSVYQDFLEKVAMQKAIKDYYGTLIPPTEITPVLDANTIDLAADETICTGALAKNTAAHNFEIAGNQNTQNRNKFSATPILAMHQIFALVKSIYPTDITAVKDWCNNITVDGKIDYSTDWTTTFNMFVYLNARYLTYAVGTAPIEFFLVKNAYVMADLMIAMNNANAQNILQASNEAASVLAMQQRDTLLEPVWDRTIIVRNYIIKLYINDSRGAANWGVKVNEAKPGQVNQVSSASPLEETAIHPLVKDTEIKNMNNFPVTIIVGEKAIPKEIIIPANGSIIVGKGMSSCKLKNTDLTNVAEIMVTVTRKKNT